MQSAVPDVIRSSEAVPSGAASASFSLALLFLLQSAAPGLQSAAPGAALDCFFRVGNFAGWASFAFFSASRSVSEMKMDSDSGDGVMEGFLMCSSDTPGGMACLVDPSLDSARSEEQTSELPSRGL